MTAISYSIKGAVDATGLSASYIKRAIDSGELVAMKSGKDSDGNPSGKWLILAADLETFVLGLAS